MGSEGRGERDGEMGDAGSERVRKRDRRSRVETEFATEKPGHMPSLPASLWAPRGDGAQHPPRSFAPKQARPVGRPIMIRHSVVLVFVLATSLLMAAPVMGQQYARPDGTVTAGIWTPAPLWEAIDEDPVDNADNNQIDSMVASFQGNNYQMKQVFAEAAVYCMGD